MTMSERAVWTELVGLPLVGLVYVGIMLARVARMPVDEVSWVVPMIWAMCSLVAIIIFGTIATAIASHVRAAARGEEATLENGDVRDKQIELLGKARTHSLTSLGSLAAIIVAMLDTDPFWIANTLFLSGILAETYGVIVKLRSYRSGF